MSEKNEVKDKSVYEVALQKLLDKIESTESFVVAQAPEVCKQILKSNIIAESMDSVFFTGLCSVMLTITYHCIDIIISNHFTSYSDKPIAYGIGALASGILGSIFGSIAYESFRNVVKIKLAPKVFLLREFKSFL